MLPKTILLNSSGGKRVALHSGRLSSLRQVDRFVSISCSNNTQQLAEQQRYQDRIAVSEARASSRIEAAENDAESIYRTRIEHLPVWHSIETIKRLGYRLARLDPLQMKQTNPRLQDLSWNHSYIERLRHDQTEVRTHGFLATDRPVMPVSELIDAVWKIYVADDCGLEFLHMTNQEEIDWLTSQWEQLKESCQLTGTCEQNLARLLLECETFDHFMAAKYPTTKRYGCEGAEPMVIVFDELLRLCHLGEKERDKLTQSIGSIHDVIIGMPHRGRLNLLTCLLSMDPRAVFSKTIGEPELDLREAWMASGDVLSHLSTNIRFVYGVDRQNFGLSRDSPQPINVSLLPNPSHLEISSPVVAGSARGRAHNIYYNYSSSPKFVVSNRNQDEQSSEAPDHYQQYFKTVLPVQVHGDAAVAGQGIIQETLQMSRLPMFTVGGSIHLVINNQIGYTTDAASARSTSHPSDVFKFIEAPIIHVNGQNINAVVRATRLALAYRQKFGKDVAIELTCYRQHGHNEMDEPSFTQPLMYDKIRSRKSIPQLYCDSIGMDPNRRLQIVDTFKSKLQGAHKQVKLFKPDNDNYRNFNLPSEYHRRHICVWRTGADLNLLRLIGLASVDLPADFNIHPNLRRALVEDRRQRFGAVNEKQLAECKIDWATAEILALGSLLKQNQSVRLAGQDVARGTFSTRHAVLIDQKTGEPIVPLNEMMQNEQRPRSARLEVANTILSEEAALAYEFGFSIETCALTIWEAQFGDFFNTAQSVIDTLVSSSETKWLKQSALTMLLPHGLDGAGPEHSSSHLERFLQMSSSSSTSIDTDAKVNWSICFPTLPSQYFHLLRRQVMRPFRKPLVVMSPKVIFRHPDCISRLADFGPERGFQPVLDDPTVEQVEIVDTIVLCSGKVFFALKEHKLKHKMHNVALVRIEELCPFPIQSIAETIRRYPNVQKNELVWFQEEHKNQGAYSFVESRLRNLAHLNLRYIGRSESELPAAGSASLHKRELELIMNQFLSLSSK